MAFKYNLLREFIDPGAATDEQMKADDLSTSAYWIIAIVHLSSPLSYSRQTAASLESLDFSVIEDNRNPKTIITTDCLSLSVNCTKESHVKSLSAMLVASAMNYLTAVRPGDWVGAWIVHSKEDADRVLKALNSNKPANGFKDGLKFVGRVHSLRKHMSLGETGIKTIQYQFQAVAFKELDAQYLYSQYLADDSDIAHNLGIGLAKIGIDLNDIVGDQATVEKMDNVHLIIPALLGVLLGKGLKDINSEQEGVPQQAYGLGSQAPGTAGNKSDSKQAQHGYLVPPTIFSFLNRPSTSASYIDLMQVVVGIQDYTSTAGTIGGGHKGLLPLVSRPNPLTKGSILYTGDPMLGCFTVLPPAYDNQPVWSMLQQFQNSTINEMYTCLKVAEDGNVYPTLVVRQIPFSTGIYSKKVKDSLKTTPYMSLPRWIVPPVIVRAIDLGLSDGTRCNFVWLLGQEPNQENNLLLPQQAGANKPIIDQYDIAKNGLYPIVQVIPVNIVNQEGAQAQQWSEMVADHMFGSQFTLNGTIECVGIQAPVCEGDNIEFEGIVYHIEGLSHNCAIRDGLRSWTTSFSLSRGLPVDDGKRSDTSETNSMYAGFVNTTNQNSNDSDILATLDPGVTDDE